MNYKFTAILILLFIGLTMFAKPAYPRNEYLNEYGARCGDFEVTTERRDTDYNYSKSSTHEDEYVRFTYRKYLGTDCKTQKENVKLKQQLELMKMCGRVNANPTLKHNPEFSLLVNKCRGIAPSSLDNRPNDANSHWDSLKNDYKKENPDVILMNDKFIGPTNETK